MHHIILDSDTDFEGWRKTARALALNDVKPADVTWNVKDAEAKLFAPAAQQLPPAQDSFHVSGKFVELAQAAILHRDRERFALLYRLLWRLRSHPNLMHSATDPDIARIGAMARAVHRDEHKMHAFVRFREVGRERDARYIAWFEPEHHIVELAAPFFARRFADMPWSIRPPGGHVAALLRQHLQSGPAQGESHAEGNAEEILEEPTRGIDD